MAYLLARPDLQVDVHNKLVVHYVVRPFDYGSYENTAMLDMLSKKFRVDFKDSHGKTPIDYA